jgi:hypothetical protein
VLATALDFATLLPGDAVVLVHPENPPDVESLARFMRVGGRVIVLDDFGSSASLLTHFGMERMAAPSQPAEMLRHNPNLPLAEPAGAHPTVIDVGRVALNHPTALRHPDLSPILRIRERGGAAGAGAIVAVAGAVQKGRLLVVADASVVINEMMRYPGNRTFARALVQYGLDDDTWGKRNGTLYVFSGPLLQKGQFGEEESWQTRLKDRVRDGSDWLQKLRSQGFSGGVAYTFAILIGLGIIVWVGKRAVRVHRPTLPRYVRSAGAVAQGGTAGRLALLASPHSSKLLGILEWKSVLDEELRLLFDCARLPPHEQLLPELARRGWLDPPHLLELRRLLLTFAETETQLLAESRATPSRLHLLHVQQVRMPAPVQALQRAARSRTNIPHAESKTSTVDLPSLGRSVKNIVNFARERAKTSAS